MNELKKRRILFVDDEPMVLKGLQRTLRKMRQDWDMTFVSSGRAALNILDKKPMDVIVSDQRMAGMTGIDFLTEVKAKWPLIKYILLTAYTDFDAIIEATNKIDLFAYFNNSSTM